MKKDSLIISVKNLCKEYDEFKLKNISFSLSNGEIVGLIGPNGAGKSTTIKLILNIIESDSGQIFFLDKDILKTNNTLYKEDIGYIGENTDFFINQKLDDIKKYYKIHYKNWNEQTYQHLFNDIFELNEGLKIKELSKGMKVKFSLALALSHNPKLLIMDEPTSGLDPMVRSKILKILKQYAENYKVAILFSSHITEDMNKIADKLVFLNNGKVLEECTVDDVKKAGYSIDEYLELLIVKEDKL